MSMALNEAIKNIEMLQIEEKEELRLMLDKIITEQKRKQLENNAMESLKELKTGKIKFHNDISNLKKDFYGNSI